jgi:hypothetical protein
VGGGRPLTWAREAIAARIEVLAAEHAGAAFVAAVRRFADEELDERDRETLGGLLLERAGGDAGLAAALAEIEEARRRPLLIPRSRRRSPGAPG